MDSNEKRIEELYKAIISINDLEICKEFFDDLCTYKEIDMMAQRLEAAKKLIDGETYDTIIKSTDISSATLSRVSRCVKYGKGYVKVINKNRDSDK